MKSSTELSDGLNLGLRVGRRGERDIRDPAQLLAQNVVLSAERSRSGRKTVCFVLDVLRNRGCMVSSGISRSRAEKRGRC